MNAEKSVSFLNLCLKLAIGLFFLSLYACNYDDNASIDNATIQKPTSQHQNIIPSNKTKTFNYAGAPYSKTFSFGLKLVSHKNMSLNYDYMFAMTRFGKGISNKEINLFYGAPSTASITASIFSPINKPFSTNVFDVKGSTVAPISTGGLVINIFNTPDTIGLTDITSSENRLINFRHNGGAHQENFNLDNNQFLSFFKRAANFKLSSNDGIENNTVDKITALSELIPVTKSTGNIVKDVVLDVAVSNVNIKTIRFDWSAVRGAVQYKLFVNPDAISGFNLLQNMRTETHTTVKIPLHLTDWINASYIVQAYDDTGVIATSSVIDIASVMQSSIGYFKAGKVAADDSFGYRVSLSEDGSTMVIGAKGKGKKSKGGVYVFSNNANKWLQQATVKASNIEQLEHFGFAMGLSADGNTLAVGALLKNANVKSSDIDKSSTEPTNLSAGVYIFNRKNTNWSQQIYLNVESRASKGLDLAVSLSADGSTLAVGISSKNNTGSVQVFNRSADTWLQQANIQAINVKAGHLFAHAVSLSANGNTLAIGAPAETVNDISPAVYVYARDDNRWLMRATVKPDNKETEEAFGAAVSLSADGNMLAVGNVLKNTVTGVRTVKPSAAVHVFKRSDNQWIQQAHIDASQAQGSNGFDVGSLFGGAISLSGDGKTLAVGTIDEGSNLVGISSNKNRGDNYANASGAVCVFTLNNSIWTQQTHIKASNTGAADLFGLAVSLSGDGKTLAVGAVDEDSGTYGIGGNQSDNSVMNSGAVYLY